MSNIKVLQKKLANLRLERRIILANLSRNITQQYREELETELLINEETTETTRALLNQLEFDGDE
jgi:hypothetical protein